ncbi:hypothetical protein DOY81_001957 [Sarcophaga bullata]|nr:hypothetical protein DOY81_001957 [Sarcophaga bullata]
MQQIEEKRRAIKLLRDKEQQQEEVLTRRLQEQLKTMKLEEQLEKERIKAVKVRFDAEQNRLSREHLLAKLENDTQLLLDSNLNEIGSKTTTASNNETNKENIANKQDNKVYKYFSNSEKHEYTYRNKSSSLPSEIDLEIDQSELGKIERECFHLSEKICPMCDEPLKELENFCLRCQNKISFRLRSPGTDDDISRQTNFTKSNSKEKTNANQNHEEKSFFLVCIRCERLYSWCKTCTSKMDVCRACQNKRNLCMSCRKTLCSFCLEEVACGKDAESLHINDSGSKLENEQQEQNVSQNVMSYHVLHNNQDFINNDNKSSNVTFSPEYTSLNNSNINHQPYSINIEQNSIFHPNNKPFTLFSSNEDKYLKSSNEAGHAFNDKNGLIKSDVKNIEKLRKDIDKRLSRYLRNYGDLAYQTRGTQTTPTGSGRRDIVLQGEQSLSIPLLREMPKMTRMETNKLKENSKELEDLQRRWDVWFLFHISEFYIL